MYQWFKSKNCLIRLTIFYLNTTLRYLHRQYFRVKICPYCMVRRTVFLSISILYVVKYYFNFSCTKQEFQFLNGNKTLEVRIFSVIWHIQKCVILNRLIKLFPVMKKQNGTSFQHWTSTSLLCNLNTTSSVRHDENIGTI